MNEQKTANRLFISQLISRINRKNVSRINFSVKFLSGILSFRLNDAILVIRYCNCGQK